MRWHRDVARLRDELGHVGELAEPVAPDARAVHLQFQVRDDRQQIDVADALADAVDRALHLRRARMHRGKRARHRAPRIVVAVDADLLPREAPRPRRARPRSPRAATRLRSSHTDPRNPPRRARRRRRIRGRRRHSPCSRRRNARHRTRRCGPAPSGTPPSRRSCAGFPRARSAMRA